MTKVTDPDILKQLNEGTDQPAEKPKGFMERHPQFAQDVSDLGSVAKGVARSAANTAGAIFSADEWLNRKITGQPTPPADPAITAIREFGNAPNANVPESFGYWGGEAAQAIGSTPSAIAK